MNEFRNYWEDAPVYPQGKRFIAEDERFWVSRDNHGAAIVFIQEDSTLDEVGIEDVFSGLVLYQDRGLQGFRIVCRLEDQLIQDKFGYVFENIARSAKSLKHKALFEYIHQELKQWSGFLKPKREGLSDEELLGIWGELFVVSKFYQERYSPIKTVESYVGPEGSSQDIEGLDFVLEVKTTKSKTPKSLMISSLEQIDSRCEEQAICLLRVDKSDEGISLDGLIVRIEKYLKTDIDALVLFRKKVHEVVSRATDVQMSVIYTMIEDRCWKTNKPFPALRRSETPHEIIKANYSIAIAAIKEFEVAGGIGGYLNGIDVK